MDLLNLIKDFEGGLEVKEEFYLKHKTEGVYFKLAFDNEHNDEGFRDVYVYESKEIVLAEEISVGMYTYPKGTKLLVEVSNETHTLYSHELSCEDLITHLEENFDRLSKPKAFIANTDEEWEYLEELL